MTHNTGGLVVLGALFPLEEPRVQGNMSCGLGGGSAVRVQPRLLPSNAACPASNVQGVLQLQPHILGSSRCCLVLEELSVLPLRGVKSRITYVAILVISLSIL